MEMCIWLKSYNYEVKVLKFTSGQTSAKSYKIGCEQTEEFSMVQEEKRNEKLAVKGLSGAIY